MNNWFLQDCNQEIIKAEHKILATKLPKMFGYFLLQLGGSCKKDFLPENNIANRIILRPEGFLAADVETNISYVQGEYENLPFLPESIDVALCIHVLEFSPNPRAIIKELYQSLVFGGSIIIFGFSLFSILGLKKIFARKKNNDSDIFCGRFIKHSKVRVWLTQAGFNDIELQRFNYNNCYMFYAQKKAVAAIPLQKSRILNHLPLRNFAVKPTPATNSDLMVEIKK